MLDTAGMAMAISFTDPIQVSVVNVHQLAFFWPLPARERALVIRSFWSEREGRPFFGAFCRGRCLAYLHNLGLQRWIGARQYLSDA